MHDSDIENGNKLEIKWTWKLLSVLEKLRLFSKPGSILFCVAVLSCTVFVHIVQMKERFMDEITQTISGLGSLICSYGFSSSIPLITSNIFHQFMKKHPGCKSVYPTYSLLAVCCNLVGTTIFVASIVLFIQSPVYSIEVIPKIVFYIILNFLLLFVALIPFLVIGTSTSFIIDNCSKVARFN